jgi:hypothetical protein
MAITKTCKGCQAFVRASDTTGMCLLHPPVPISAYASEYPVVRPENMACMQFKKIVAPRQRKAAPKK